MSATYETVLQDVETLAREEQFHLFSWLRKRFPSTGDLPTEENGEDADEVEAAWDAELAKRIEDVRLGRVELISAEESERRLDAVFAKHGIDRRTPSR